MISFLPCQKITYPLMWLVFFMLISCTKNESVDHPLVITGDIMNVTSTGAEFHGRIIDQGSGIIDHGFVWDQHKEPLIGKAYQLSLGPYTSDDFSSATESAFKEGDIYYVRAYVRDSRSTVYGRTATFKSLGGASPHIFDFYPKEGTWSDTITIRGKYFSRLNDQNMIKTGIYTATCIWSSDTLLKAIIPNSLLTASSKVSVTVFGNTSASTDNFVLLAPEIHEITPEEGPINTTVTLSGKYFHAQAKVYFNDKQAEILSASSNQILARVPSFSGEQDVKITVNVLGQINKEEYYFKYFHPVITGFSSSTGTWDDPLVIYGRNLPVHAGTIVKFSNAYATIIHKTKDSITVVVPYYAEYSNYITILDNHYYQHTTSDMKFELYKPTITGFTPGQADFDEIIEISGTHFHPDIYENIVSFGEAQANIVSHSTSLLKVKVPVEIQETPAKLSLKIHNYKLYATETFKLQPLQIDRTENQWFSRSHPLKIYGSGFNPDSYRMNVFWGDEKLWVWEQGPGFILAEKDYARNNNQHLENRTVRVEVAGQTVQLDYPIRYYQPWTYHALADYYLRSVKDVSFSINGRHYIAELNSLLHEFLPGTNTLVARANLPVNTSGTNDYSHTSTFTGASKAYFLHRQGFYRYDPALDTWSEMNKFPGIADKGTKAFKAGDTGYMIGAPTVFSENGTTIEGREVWRYNEVDDSWTRVASFPSMLNILLGVSFSLDGKGYVGLGQGPFANKLWEYDPEENKWLQKIDLTNILGADVYASSSVFVLDNYAYIAGHQGSQQSYGEVYRYDPVKNTFTLMVGLPDGTSGAFGFTHQGKGYVLGGYAGGWHSAVQIFDPTKLPPALLLE